MSSPHQIEMSPFFASNLCFSKATETKQLQHNDHECILRSARGVVPRGLEYVAQISLALGYIRYPATQGGQWEGSLYCYYDNCMAWRLMILIPAFLMAMYFCFTKGLRRTTCLSWRGFCAVSITLYDKQEKGRLARCGVEPTPLH